MKRILLCVTGGIAAYKAIDLASRLVKLDYELKCILTKNALQFVGAASFSAIIHNSVHVEMFGDPDPVPHITLADWADLVVVAPSTANILAKAAHGIGDDLLSTVLLAHTKPVLYIPAMNVHMYESDVVQSNIAVLESRNNILMKPDRGMLACGYEGKGKYPPNDEVVCAISTYLSYGQDLVGKKVLVTAGATVEAIDPMRYLSNRSSGLTGINLARNLALRGAEVYLIHGRIEVSIPYYLAASIFTESAAEMEREVSALYKGMDWVLMCAAVADYTPCEKHANKLPKGENLSMHLCATKDILAQMGQAKAMGQKLIGFAAQTDKHLQYGLDKLKRKNLDMICVNDIGVAGKIDSKVTVVGKFTDHEPVPDANEFSSVELNGSKFDIAHRIIDLIKEL